jgi:hypothetical protein
MKKMILFFALIVSSQMIKAQSLWEAGLFVGAAGYSGDVTPSLTPRVQDFTPSVGMVARTNINNHFGFRTGFSYLKLQGDDQNYESRKSRDFNFKTTLIELSILGEWEPFGSNRYYTDAAGSVNMDRLISPYLFGGVGLLGGVLNTNFTNYQGSNETILAGIQKDKSYGNSLIGISVPVGIGVRFDINKTFTLAIETCVRASFSDYLDGISFSGGPDAKDIYLSSGLLLFYRFGSPK